MASSKSFHFIFTAISSTTELKSANSKSRIHTPTDSAFVYTLLFSILYEAVNHRNHTIYTELCHIQAQVIVFCLSPLLSGIVFVSRTTVFAFLAETPCVSATVSTQKASFAVRKTETTSSLP